MSSDTPSPPELYVLAQEIQSLSGVVIKTARRDLEQRLEAEGIGTLPFGVLRVLEHEPLTLAEVSRRMHLAPASLVGAVDVLQARGLLTRGTDERDRRRTPLLMTPAGRALLARVSPLDAADALYQALAAMEPNQAVALRDLLRTVVGAFSDGAAIVEGVATRAHGGKPIAPTPSEGA